MHRASESWPAVVRRHTVLAVISPSLRTKRPGSPCRSSQRGPLLAEQERSLGRHVGDMAARAGDGHLRPAGTARAAAARVDQMVLPLAGSEPVPARDPARRETTGVHGHRFASRERHDARAADGQVAARRNEAVAGQKGQRVVDRKPLDDAVQVEHDARRQRHQRARHTHIAPAPGRRGADGAHAGVSA